MGRRPKSHKSNAVSETAKNPSPTPETRMDDSEPPVLEHPVVSNWNKQKKLVCVRRSGRLQSLIKPAQNQEVEHVIEEIDLVGSEREEDERDVENYIEQPFLESHEIEGEQRNDDSHNEPTPKQKTLEEKVDYLVKAFDEFKSKGMQGHVSSKGMPTNFNYKYLYFGCQKKIEALTNENHELARKLEIAHVKLEAYEKMKAMMEKCQETAVISNFAKATEAMVNLTSQVVVGGQVSSPGGLVEPSSAAMAKKSQSKKKRQHEASN